MTRVTRKLVCAITLISFLAAVFVFFAWATSGFRNWNAAMWFNYWGKGASVAEAIVESQETAQTNLRKDSFNVADSLTLRTDSEETVATISVTTFAMPALCPYGGEGRSDFGVSIDGLCGDKIEVQYCYANTGEVFKTEFWNIPGHDYTQPYTNGFSSYSTCFRGAALFENFNVKEYIDANFPFVAVRIRCVGTGSYVGSDWATYFFCIPFGHITYSSFDTATASAVYSSYAYDSVKDMCSYSVLFSSGALVEGFNYPHYGVFYDTDYDLSNVDLNSDVASIQSDGSLKLEFAQLGFIDSGISSFSYKIEPVFIGSIDTYMGEVSDIVVLDSRIDGMQTVGTLASPSNIHINDNKLCWTGPALEGLSGRYSVFVGDRHFMTDSQFIDLNEISDLFPESGEYTVRVRALGNIGNSAAKLGTLTPYNASLNIEQAVTISLNVGGDVVTKIVPYGSKISDYLYDVSYPGKEFGGWFYDSGYSIAVNATDTLDKDVTIYARLMDNKITERPLTWWEKNMWYLIGAAITLVVGLIVVGIVVGVKKQKA